MTDEVKPPYPKGTAIIALIPNDELDYDNGKPGYTVEVVLAEKGVVDRVGLVALGIGVCANDAKWSFNILNKMMDRLEKAPDDEKQEVMQGKGKWVSRKPYTKYKGE